jgi:hypothetical protein
MMTAAAKNEVTKSHVTAFRDSMLARYATPTANLYLKIIKMVFRSARLDGYLWQDPAEGVKTVKNREPLTRRPFTLDELRAILAVADPEWQSLIKFGLYTGQRLSDLASLTWSQIDLDRDEIRIKTRKTSKPLLIPVAQPLREHLLTQATSDNPKAPAHPYKLPLPRPALASLGNRQALRGVWQYLQRNAYARRIKRKMVRHCSIRIKVSNFSTNCNPIARVSKSPGKLLFCELKDWCAGRISCRIVVVLHIQSRGRKGVPTCLLPHAARRTTYHIVLRRWDFNGGRIKSAFSLAISRKSSAFVKEGEEEWAAAFDFYEPRPSRVMDFADVILIFGKEH